MFNIVVLVLASAIALVGIVIKSWCYDGVANLGDIIDFKFVAITIDIIKDGVFIYYLLYFLLYGFK